MTRKENCIRHIKEDLVKTFHVDDDIYGFIDGQQTFLTFIKCF